MTATISNLEALRKERDSYIKGIESSERTGLNADRQKKFLAIVEQEIAALEGQKKNDHESESAGERGSTATELDSSVSTTDNSRSLMDADIKNLDERYLFKSEQGAKEYQFFKEQLRGKLLNFLKKQNKSEYDILQMNWFVPSIICKLESIIDWHGREDYKFLLKNKSYFITRNDVVYKYGFDIEEIKKNFDF